MKGIWPQLALLKAKPVPVYTPNHHLDLPQECHFQLVASLVSVTAHVGQAKAQLIIPKTKLSELAQHSHVAAAFSHLHGDEWQRMEHLSMKIHIQGSEVMKQLACLSLPCLKYLNLRNSKLGALAMQQLAK